MNVYLCKMTKAKMHALFRAFSYDPSALPENDNSRYRYDAAAVDAYFEKHMRQGKIHFAIMLGDTVIGDVYLKNVNFVDRFCTVAIHMANDTYKGHGYGTQAEKLILTYAFQELNMKVVYADTLIKNERSRHILEKVGFTEIRRDNQSIYYACRKSNWGRS